MGTPTEHPAPLPFSPRATGQCAVTPDVAAPALAEWQAELKLAECGCALPLAWPLPQWVDDYRRLLTSALGDRKIGPRAEWRADTARAFLPLLLAARDESVAEFMRTLARRQPLAEETRQLRRVQALFVFLRPARSLCEGFGLAMGDGVGRVVASSL